MSHSQLQSSVNIAVIDDNLDNLRLLTNILRNCHYQVRSIPDSNLAISSIQSEPPDLILLDILMPGMDGYEVCSLLKSNDKTRDIPVIFLSALQDAFDKVKAFSVGGVDYISKPFQAEEVLVRVENQLTIWRQQKQLREQNNQLQAEIRERQLLEEKLRTSQTEIRGFFEAMTDLVMILDEGGNTIKIAPTRPHCLYPPHANIIDITVGQFFGANAETFRVPIKQALDTQQIVNFEYSLMVEDQTVWFAACLTPISEQMVAWVARDISDRKRAELALLENQRRYRTLAEVSPICIFLTDAQGQCLYMNQRWCEITGLRLEAALGSGWIKYLHPEDCDRVLQDWYTTSKTQVPFKAEYRLLLPEGRILWVIGQALAEIDHQGEVKGYVGTITDISDRKLVEAALKESEERFYLAVSGTNDGIWDWNLKTNTVYYSPVFQQILGYCGLEFPAEPEYWLDKIHCEDLPEVIKAFQDHLSGRNLLYKSVHRVQHKTGEWLWIEAKGNCLRDVDNIPYRIIGTIANITPRKQVEEALQKAVLAADAANRAKSEFLASMSHELRTPLNAILGFTQVMNRDSSLSLENQKNLEIINRAGEHLLNLINDILEMSKIEAGKISFNETEFDLIHLLNDLANILRLRAESKGLRLNLEYEQSLPQYVCTDEGKLRQILINLLGNAIKFTEQGYVTLRVKQQPFLNSGELQEIRNSNQQCLAKNCLIFEVEDTGIGIAPEEIHLLFEAFVQTESGRKSHQGTGLGLPISRKYVQMMGGEIKVKSTPNVGSLFSFDIQAGSVDQACIQQFQPKRQVLSLAPNQPETRILIVDDRPDSRLLLVKLLSPLGFNLCEAENGSQAIAEWENWNPHLIFMDIRMPILDGYEATRQIRMRESRIPESGDRTVIIALTASAFEEDRQGILAVGCNDCIYKPIREEIILDKISQYLGIQYLWKDAIVTPDKLSVNASSEHSTTDLETLLSSVSKEWLAQIYDAVLECSDDRVLELIQQLPPEQDRVAIGLTNLVEDFQFEFMIQLLQPWVEHSPLT